MSNFNNYNNNSNNINYFNNFNNINNVDNATTTLSLNEKEINEICTKFDIFTKFLSSVLKKFISLKMNPLLKVQVKENLILKVQEQENQVLNIQGKENPKMNFKGYENNNILLYLMTYPLKDLLEYFIKELKIPINDINITKRNSLFFLFDNIANIKNVYYINKNLVIDTLNYLIKEGIYLEQIDYLGNNPFLYLAMNNFDENILTILSENKCDINKFNNEDNNCLFLYVRKKNLNIVKKLIENFKVDYTLCDSKKRTIMHYLCNDEISSTDMDERLCDYLLTKEINLNQPDILGRTPIHYLFVKINDEYNNSDIDPINTLTKLLEYKDVDPEYKDIYGNTPLHYACQRGSIISIISLGGKKIDYDIKNKENNTPLAYSFLFKKENVAINLIQQNVNLDEYAYPIRDRNETILKLTKKREDEQTNKNKEVNIEKNFIGTRKNLRKNFNNNFNNAFNNVTNTNFGFNNNNGLNNNFNNSFNNIIFTNQNKISFNDITNLFKENKKCIKLFRLCIKNNFQGLAHLFITRGYGLMKAVEDSFNEQQFNLAMKLLNYSPYNKTYQALNNDGQNLFHILANIKINNLTELPQLLDKLYSKEIPLNAKDNFGNTPLHYAAKNLFKELIQFILNKYKNKKLILNIENNDNYTPFILSIKGNNINLITQDIFDLLFTTKNINQLYEEDEKLINKSNRINSYKCSVLLYIVRIMLKKSDETIFYTKLYYFYEKLIKNGASINEKDSYGRSCLFYAVLENNLIFLQMLCKDAKNKIDKNIIDNKGKSLVHYCVSLNNYGSYENEKMLQYLLDNKFISTIKDNLRKTPLDYALEQKTLTNLKILKNNKIPGTEKKKLR